jgi:hypothetical protein
MSDTTENVPQPIARMLDEEAPIAPADTNAPMYRIDPTSKVPVSKHYGKLWDSRLTAAMAARKVHVDAWDEAIRYYNHSQLEYREGGRDNQSGNRYFSRRRNNQWSETENIVYANTRAIMPALYAKNPQAEFSTPDDERKPFVQMVEDLVNALAPMAHAPGLNLKVHAKQAVLAAELCNLGWLEYGYVDRGQSMIAAQEQIDALGKELEEAKDSKTLREVEGKLMAMEETLAILTPPGPFVRYRAPHDVVCDANAVLPDFSDAQWIAIAEVYPTDYLNARFGERDEDGRIKSLYQPTHVLSAGESGEDDIKNFKLFKTDAEASEYGYKNREALQKAYRTKCWRIWDKITRRVFLYADNKWDWPVWVETDPYGLPGFFPMRALYFNTAPLGAYARSNVTYYLDQQDGINEIHDEFRRARQDIKENVLFDDEFDRDTVEKWLRGAAPSAHGVKVPEGKTLKDMILEKPNAMLRALPLFDAQRLMQSIDRISGVSDVLRNVQFKTNTTNKAIENYNSSTAMRLDEKIDAIEDALGNVLYGIGFLCARFMPPEEVVSLIGTARAGEWTNYDAAQLRMMFRCTAVGGSTQKPTSAAKKQQALEMARLLMQAAQFAPGTSIETMMTLFDDAFDELTLPDNWAERVAEESKASQRRGSSDVGAQEGGAAGAGAGVPGAQGAGVSVEEIAAAVDALPPAAKIALGRAMAQGVPIAEALPEVLRAVQTTGETLQ